MKEDRYMKNRHSAKRVTRDIFAGSTLHSFDPSWTFNHPPYLYQSTFSLPDWAVGLLAERLGLTWIWEDYHPMEQMRQHIISNKKTVKTLQTTLQEYSTLISEKK